MNDFLHRTWADVSLDALSSNYRAIRRRVGTTRIMCMVKGDAYGHGAVPVARHLQALGADYFGVAELDEAVQLREGGVDAPILIMGCTPPDCVPELIARRITQTVTGYDEAARLSEAAAGAGGRLTVHIKLDTGMGRLGIVCTGDPSTAAWESLQICGLPGLQVEGIYTHFATADDSDETYFRFQLSNFNKVVRMLSENGVEIAIKHCANSASVLKYTQTYMDMVRPGIILYGLSPYDDGSLPADFTPVLSLRSSVVQIKEVCEDTSVSYGRTFRAARRTRLAVLAAGYADGLPRLLSNRASMLAHGERLPLAGRVCMDLCMLDATDAPALCEGDTVTIFGRDGGAVIRAEEQACLAGTISYELATGIGKRVPRVYYKDDSPVEILNYIKMLQK